MKLLQVHCFYDQYLHTFYEKNLGLAGQSYKHQAKTLSSDWFAASHLFAHYLTQAGIDSELIIANNPYAQVAWARENNLLIQSENSWKEEILRAQIELYEPDILYLSHPIDFDSRFIRTLKKRPNFIFGWRAAPIPSDTDWSEFNLILSHLSVSREQALKHGARSVRHFIPGFPVDIAQQVANIQKTHDVVFTGQWSTLHSRRCKYLEAIATGADTCSPPLSVAYYLASTRMEDLPSSVSKYWHPEQWGLAMHQAIKSGKVNINAEIDMARGEAGNMRLFETLGTGSFLLTEHHENIGLYATPGKHFETFRSVGELVDKAHYFAQHDAEREAICSAGQKWCHEHHSMEKRTEELVEILIEEIESTTKSQQTPPINQEHAMSLVQKDFTVPPTNDSSSARKDETQMSQELLSNGLDALEGGDTGKAFALLIEAKKIRIPTRDLDYVRALCFIQMGRLGDAREALNEELRHFPDNGPARQLLQQVLDEDAKSKTTQIQIDENPEFESLLNTIRPYSMLPKERLFWLFSFAKQVCQHNIQGNFVECGVAAGGSTAMLSALIKAHSSTARTVFAFDSFEGMPTPTAEDTLSGKPADDTGWGTGTCAAPESSLRDICTKLGTMEIVRPIKGYFENTLAPHKQEVGPIALLHADCDWFKSALTIFDTFYDSLVPGAVVQLDDYGYWDGMRKAMDEFQQRRNLSLDIHMLNGAAWFQKPQ